MNYLELVKTKLILKDVIKRSLSNITVRMKIDSRFKSSKLKKFRVGNKNIELCGMLEKKTYVQYRKQ